MEIHLVSMEIHLVTIILWIYRVALKCIHGHV